MAIYTNEAGLQNAINAVKKAKKKGLLNVFELVHSWSEHDISRLQTIFGYPASRDDIAKELLSLA